MKDRVSIKISKEVKTRLTKLQGSLQARSGKKISISDVIKYLIDRE